MFPIVYGFKWELGHLIFLTAFFVVLTFIVVTVMVALTRSYRDFKGRKQETISWNADFEDLPLEARSCRHELTGECKRRKCVRGFDCRECGAHADFLAQREDAGGSLLSPQEAESTFGFNMPSDRLYHRGHTWVRQEPDGSATIGLDDFASRLLGRPDEVKLPVTGEAVQVNGTAWRLRKGSSEVRILCPIDGEVLAVGGVDQDWFLKVKPPAGRLNTTHLLTAPEIQPWLLREMERLQLALSGGLVGASLADGGVPVQDPSAAYPEADWDTVWGEVFLQA